MNAHTRVHPALQARHQRTAIVVTTPVLAQGCATLPRPNSSPPRAGGTGRRSDRASLPGWLPGRVAEISSRGQDSPVDQAKPSP
jgi:hypothetical protein